MHDRDQYDVPFLPAESIPADRLLPQEGTFRWNEYHFVIRLFPGQTWWHCAFDARIDSRHVLFSGDNFQPPTRWNGTGGFCAFNGSRFSEGFARSAQTVLDIAPEIICNGHGIIYRFAASQYRRILRWSAKAKKALQALCPSAAWLADYDYRALSWQPFVRRAKPGDQLELSLVYRNYHRKARALRATPVGLPGWTSTPGYRTARVAAGKSRTLTSTIDLAKKTPKGRHLLTADVELDGRLMAEACVAIVDIV